MNNINYNNSIVNLMSTILYNFNKEFNNYHKPLEINFSNHIILIVIDGMGDNLVEHYCNIFKQNKKYVIDSVFPTTTTAAMTSIHTGKTPYEHGNISRFSNMKEYGITGMPLPFTDRLYNNIIIEEDEYLDHQYNYFIGSKENVYSKIKNSYTYIPKNILHSEFSKSYLFGSIQYGYYDFFNNSVIKKISKNITLHKNNQSFHHLYFPGLDSCQHEFGIFSNKTQDLIQNIEKQINDMRIYLQEHNNEDISIIITADHGHTEVQERIDLNEFDGPGILTIPPTGDTRVTFLYPRFNEYDSLLKKLKLDNRFITYEKDDFLNLELLGSGNNKHQYLDDRIGDIILIANQGYGFGNFLLIEKPDYEKSLHSGLSIEEIKVPLIIFDLNN